MDLAGPLEANQRRFVMERQVIVIGILFFKYQRFETSVNAELFPLVAVT